MLHSNLAPLNFYDDHGFLEGRLIWHFGMIIHIHQTLQSLLIISAC